MYLQKEMIRLQQSTVNDVVVTLTELTTQLNPYYLFSFTSDTSNDSKIFISADTSTNIDRYNRFSIELTAGTENLLTGVIKLPLKGFYKYVIYSQASSTNLLIANTTEIVEEGKVYVNDTVTPVITVYTDGNDNKIVYNG